MACGTPVLGVNIAHTGLIDDKETGFLVQDNSPVHLADEIVKTLAYPVVERIVRNARALLSNAA